MKEERLRFLNGNFFRGEEKIPIAIGDNEQIKLIEIIKELQSDWHLMSIVQGDNNKLETCIPCPCGYIISPLETGTLKCPRCTIKYLIAEDESDFIGMWVYKIKSLK